VFEVSVLDQTPPAAPIITGFTPDTGLQGDHLTEARTLTLSGTSEPGVVRVVIRDDAGVSIALAPDQNGKWSTTFSALAFGSHHFTATPEDASGNISAASDPFAIDVALPPPPVITGFSPDTGVVGDHVTEARTIVV